ncbi:hypothetical protein [Paramesorhizobium deserti]|nr:hypothetical protein [Paramesorhizobium deserti]
MADAQPKPSSSILIAHPKQERYVLNTAEKQRVKKGVLGWLKHPETARFRQITAVKGQRSVTVCGYVTAKNLSNTFEGHIENKGYVLFIGTLFSRGFVMTGVALGDQAKVVTRTCNEDVFE